MSDLLLSDGAITTGAETAELFEARPQLAAVVRTPPDWSLPLAFAVILHLVALVAALAVPRLGEDQAQLLEVYPIRLYSATEAVAEKAIVDRSGQVAPLVRRMSIPSSPIEAVEAPPLPVVAEVAPVSVASESSAMDEDATPAPPARQSGETPVATAAISGGATSGPVEAAKGWPGGGGTAVSGGVEGVSRPDQLAEVSAYPLYRENPQPAYPPLARRRQLEGTVILEVLVGTTGAVGGLEVQQSSGHRLLDEAAMKGVRSWRFEPGRRGVAAVAMKVLVPVRFRLR